MYNKTYNSLTVKEKEQFFSFLQSTQQTAAAANANMWHANWQSRNETLPFLLENTDRFNGITGEFHIFYDNSMPIACGGIYISKFDKSVGIAGVRTWVDPIYRHRSILREVMLPLHKQWGIDRNIKIISLTFNEYNKNLIQVFKRSRLGESTDRIHTRQPHHLFFNGLIEVPFLVTIQYTPQWVIYEKLDASFDFDWNLLKIDNS